MSTTWLSRVTQNALAPWAVPSGCLSGECHSMNQAPPFERTAKGSRSTIGGGKVLIVDARPRRHALDPFCLERQCAGEAVFRYDLETSGEYRAVPRQRGDRHRGVRAAAIEVLSHECCG